MQELVFILSIVTKLTMRYSPKKISSSFFFVAQNDPFFMALCRETRESIHQIIRISHSSNFDNNTMDCTSWWWRKSDYRIPTDLTKGWNWDRKEQYHRPWDEITYSFRGLEKNTNYTVKLFSRNFVFEGDPIVRKISTLFEGEESQMISWLSTLHQSFFYQLRFVPVLIMLSARRRLTTSSHAIIDNFIIRFFILNAYPLLSGQFPFTL